MVNLKDTLENSDVADFPLHPIRSAANRTGRETNNIEDTLNDEEIQLHKTVSQT